MYGKEVINDRHNTPGKTDEGDETEKKREDTVRCQKQDVAKKKKKKGKDETDRDRIKAGNKRIKSMESISVSRREMNAFCVSFFLFSVGDDSTQNRRRRRQTVRNRHRKEKEEKKNNLSVTLGCLLFYLPLLHCLLNENFISFPGSFILVSFHVSLPVMIVVEIVVLL